MIANLRAWLRWLWRQYQAGPPPVSPEPVTLVQLESALERLSRRLLVNVEVAGNRQLDRSPITVRFVDEDECCVRGEKVLRSHERKAVLDFEGKCYRIAREDQGVWIYREVTR